VCRDAGSQRLHHKVGERGQTAIFEAQHQVTSNPGVLERGQQPDAPVENPLGGRPEQVAATSAEKAA
jgi:hypothetical protein